MVIDVPDEDILDTNEVVRPRAAPGANDVGFTDMKAQLERVTKEKDEEKRRADDAARRASDASAQAQRDRTAVQQARADAKSARTESAEGRKIALTNAATTQKTVMDGLESEYANALEAGDFRKSAAIQRKMSEAAADLKQIEAGLSSIEIDDPAPRRTAEGRVERDQPTPDAPEDPFEKYLKQFSPIAQAWLRKHPENVTDQAKNAFMIAAHHEAIQKGYAAEGEAYFAYLERKLGYRSDAAADAVRRDNPIDDGDRQPQQRGDPMRSAPVSRGNGAGGSSSQVSLSPGEMEAATNTVVWNVGQTDHRGVRLTKDDPRVGEPIGTYEFARRKRAMEKEGRYVTPYAS
jgi:hypothetical protein